MRPETECNDARTDPGAPAPVAQLDVWLDGILDAASVEALVGKDTGRAP